MQNKTFNHNRRHFLRSSLAGLAGLSVASLVSANKVINDNLTVLSENFVPPTPQKLLELHYNENAIGMSPKAKSAAIEALNTGNRYRFTEAEPLRALIAQSHNVKEENILFSAGSSDAIRIAIAAHATPGTQFVVPELTYGDGEDFAKAYNLKIAKIKSNPQDWSIDLKGMQEAVAKYQGPSIVYLVNPNNPTSTIIKSNEIETWINSKPKDTLFILDEAYAEYVNSPDYRSVDYLIAQGADNVVLLKTFSKIHAMAGMRVGYTVAVADKIKQLQDHVELDSLTLSNPSIQAATASIQDKDFLAYSKKSNDSAREIYLNTLQELNIEYLPSETNFVFHKIKGDIEAFRQRMLEENIKVGRPFPPANDWCRVSVGTTDEMIYVSNKLREFRQKGWL
ncbi:histidinol-phosphate aminotransferase [Volucribacter psittacicida]|uniref:Histidinol-phosphate aminotransferase n=1 Tax=Volucribacter psittacicida TaxID=203482 RepID=A0A4R1FN82_9PAST|nr:aminotransferase class I/II-fold pyridoxal phosphate-dependent enzyme [Volucribacter psittacicida]TCJ96237.1 histidinol-phosphate aminotransferase [Volucribacter psittacicida]